MSDKADHVITGTVTDYSKDKLNEYHFDVYDVEVEQVYKGEVLEEEIVPVRYMYEEMDRLEIGTTY